MSEKFKPEKKEFARKVELKIVEPLGDKNYMIGFEGKSQEECQAYNWAIESVLKKAELSPFHQVGTTPFGQHEPGYHAWEIWKKASKEKLQELLSEIEQAAQGMLPE